MQQPSSSPRPVDPEAVIHRLARQLAAAQTDAAVQAVRADAAEQEAAQLRTEVTSLQFRVAELETLLEEADRSAEPV